MSVHRSKVPSVVDELNSKQFHELAVLLQLSPFHLRLPFLPDNRLSRPRPTLPPPGPARRDRSRSPRARTAPDAAPTAKEKADQPELVASMSVVAVEKEEAGRPEGIASTSAVATEEEADLVAAPPP